MNDSILNETYISRQPILDGNQELIGYELMLLPAKASLSPLSGGPSRAAMLICAAYAEFGIRSALGRHTAFLRIDGEFLHDDAIEALPPGNVVLLLVLDGPPDTKTLERCRALRERHYALALADYEGLDERSTPLLTMLDYVRIDTRGKDARTLIDLAGPLARLPLKLLAQGVETTEQLAICRQAGFHLFQGRHFANPEIVSGRRVAASQASIIHIINLAARDADNARIEDGIKREPALAVNLLSIVNSVGYGMARRISSLRQAITVLGRRQLQRWLQLLLMTPPGKAPDPSRIPLLQVASMRGRMMEILADRIRPRDSDFSGQAFITGIMSMMPVALGLPLKEIFEQIALEEEIVSALLSHEGILGRILELVEHYDAEDAEGCDRLLAEILGAGLDRNYLNTCLIESLRWVNSNEPDNDMTHGEKKP